MRDLSILIPANKEEFLSKTIEDILANIEADTEVIAVLDGSWANPPISQHPRVNVIYVPESIGQRAATNLACKLSTARYVMKVDAHCAFDKGFDKKMIATFRDNAVMIPVMKNLHAYDWKCFKCGKKIYQDRKPICPVCGNGMKKKMIWQPRSGTSSVSYCFDTEPHFQYFSAYKLSDEYKRDFPTGITKTMIIQGSCFMLTREKYWELNISDESYGSWGNQGIEIGCKVWLSGGQVLVNHNTWYAHMFRTKPENGFGFPWERHEGAIRKTKKNVWNDIVGFKLPKQIYPVSWLLEKFWPVPKWSEEDLKKLK